MQDWVGLDAQWKKGLGEQAPRQDGWDLDDHRLRIK